MKLTSLLTYSIFFIAPAALAEIPNDYRNENAVVYYDFAETSGDILDKGNSKFGAALNLEIYYPNSVTRAANYLSINEPNVIRSKAPADKIYNACKTTGELSVELYIKPNETVQKRSGNDSKMRPQPLRILSFSKSLFERNFVFGQFYDNGNLYMGGVATVNNENQTDRLGNSLTDQIINTPASTLVPNSDIGRTEGIMQKVVFTLGPAGVGRLYLSDSAGNMYLATSESMAFGSGNMSNYFSTWRSGAYLTLGNESISKTDFGTVAQLDRFFEGCNAAKDASNQCFTNPNRYWKGVVSKVAVYCKEVPREVVLGDSAENIRTASAQEIPSSLTISESRLKAQAIYTRLTGVKTPITNPELDRMIGDVEQGRLAQAAAVATENPNFYNIVVRDFAAKMSNRDETINAPLNDFTASIIGAVRDEMSAQALLTDNFVYVGDPTKAPVPSDLVVDLLTSNNHFDSLDKGRYDLSKVLIKQDQQLFDGKKAVHNDYAAGLLTTRQWMAAHAIAGTNRRLVEYSFRQFLCSSIDKVSDTSGPDNVVARDIDRFPGGVHSKYTSSCRGCHTIMDGFRPAFARWTFSNNFAKHTFVVGKLDLKDDEAESNDMHQSPDFIAYKLNKNETVFPQGGITYDESWVNNANYGANAATFKWTKTKGKGTREFGQMIVESPVFAECLAERVFQTVCKRTPISYDRTLIKTAANEFAKDHGYNLKFLFQRIVASPECLGGAE